MFSGLRVWAWAKWAPWLRVSHRGQTHGEPWGHFLETRWSHLGAVKSGYKYRWSLAPLPPAHLLPCSLAPHRPWAGTVHGPGLGIPALNISSLSSPSTSSWNHPSTSVSVDLIILIFLFCCSVAKPCPTLCDHMDCSTPGFLVLHNLPELAQTHVHWIRDAIQPSHPLSSPSPSALNLS